jgi:hypothetical protein
MKEHPWPESGDPAIVDQIVDMDRGVQIDHTARLSGSLIPFMANNSFESEVEISVLPVTPIAGPAVAFQLANIVSPLAPGAPVPNVWFWRPGTTTNELLFSAQVIIPAGQMGSKGFKEEETYKLVYQWKFFHLSPTGRQRMPVSGFDEAIAFQVIKRTVP